MDDTLSPSCTVVFAGDGAALRSDPVTCNQCISRSTVPTNGAARRSHDGQLRSVVGRDAAGASARCHHGCSADTWLRGHGITAQRSAIAGRHTVQLGRQTYRPCRAGSSDRLSRTACQGRARADHDRASRPQVCTWESRSAVVALEIVERAPYFEREPADELGPATRPTPPAWATPAFRRGGRGTAPPGARATACFAVRRDTGKPCRAAPPRTASRRCAG